MVYAPGVAVAVADRNSVLVPAVGFWVNDAVTPGPMPLADKVTLPAKPPVGATVMSVVPCCPRAMRMLFGDADRLKSGIAAEVTVNVTVVVCMTPPPEPVTLIG